MSNQELQDEINKLKTLLKQQPAKAPRQKPMMFSEGKSAIHATAATGNSMTAASTTEPMVHRSIRRFWRFPATAMSLIEMSRGREDIHGSQPSLLPGEKTGQAVSRPPRSFFMSSAETDRETARGFRQTRPPYRQVRAQVHPRRSLPMPLRPLRLLPDVPPTPDGHDPALPV